MQYYKIRKKSFILLISYLCAAALVLAGLVYRNEQQIARYERNINASYMRAFAELSADVAELDVSLQKALYSTSPALLSALCSNIYGKASAAQTSMAELPFSDVTLENATSFITRTGDYAFALARKVSGGTELSDEEYSALAALSDTATILSQNLTDMQLELEQGTMRISDIGQADTDTDDANVLLGNRFQEIENEFPEIPTLIYDGPFSNHVDTSGEDLHEKELISPESALEIAAEFISIDKNELSVMYETSGEIPLYCFSTKDGSTSINISKHGGMIYSMSKYRAPGTANLDTEDAVNLAKEFLGKHGFDSLKESYWTRYDDMLIINFAAVDGEYICYPDLLKAEISLDNGEIIGFEAAGYILNNRPRNMPTDIAAYEDAAQTVSKNLELLSGGLCVIPSSGKREVFCYEFKCENEHGNHYLIYVNAETLEQEKIICLIENENGTLSM